MQTIGAYFDIPTEKAVQLKFEQELDKVVNQRLAKQLVQELMKSPYFKPAMVRIPRSSHNPYANDLTRFTISLQIGPTTN